MKQKIKNFLNLIKNTGIKWQEDKASRLAAALAFYAVVSIPPLLVLVIAIAGRFAGEQAARQAIVNQVGRVVGAEGQQAITTILEAAGRPEGLSLTTIISVIVLFFGASGVFVQLQETLNTIWDVQPDPEKGIMNRVQKRVFSFLLVIGIGFLLIVLLVVNSLVAVFSQMLSDVLPPAFAWAHLLNFVVSLLMMTGLIALVYKVIPDVKIAWRDVGVGAVVTAVLFMIGIFGLGQYFQYSNLTSNYGAAGSLIILLIWVYYSAQIFFLGAEFTQLYANRYGDRIRPDKGAVWLYEAEN